MGHSLALVLSYSATYVCFFLLLSFASARNANRVTYGKSFTPNPQLLLVLHLFGICLFGIVPFVSVHISTTSILNTNGFKPLPTIVSLIVLLATGISALRLSDSHYPAGTVVGASIDTSFVLSYFFARTLFIACYELWFRGFLLNDCIATMGVIPAILINLVSYAFLHFVNGKKEMLGCLPFGLLLCLLCLWQEAVWPAILIHVILTLTYEVAFFQKLKLKPIAL